MPLFDALFLESNPIPVKWALSKMGLMNNEIRMPLMMLSKMHHGALEQSMRDLNLI